MKNKIQSLLYVVAAVVVFVISYGIYQQRTPINVPMAEINSADWEAQKAAAEQSTARAASLSRARKLVACETDEDCVIVDKDPCGCVVGPQGVTAINVGQIEEFNKNLSQITQSCPDNAPSTQAQCSPTAQAVCRERACTIIY